MTEALVLAWAVLDHMMTLVAAPVRAPMRILVAAWVALRLCKWARRTLRLQWPRRFRMYVTSSALDLPPLALGRTV